MDEQKSNYSSSTVDHEINNGECSSEGEDEGEGDDEEELDEEVESVGDEDSEEEVGDEEDETIDSVSLSSENFNGFKELEYPLDESSSQDVSENTDKSINDQESSSQTKTIVASVISISPGETKFSVKLKRCKGPVKLCCLCNLGEQSQLGQGKLQKIKKPEFFVEEKLPETERVRSVEFPKVNVVTSKHRKSASRQNSSLHEPVDEHSMIGHVDKVNLSDLFDEEGFVYIHSNCALFSRQITYNDNSELENVISCVSKSLTRICSHCNRYGASVTCSFNNCDKTYHYPCSAASAGFQHLKTHSFICNTHIDHIPLLPTFNEVSCHMCFSLGDVSNLIMCSICGNHYHGICLGRALLPGVRTGWQCSECRSCQICQASEESSKIMLCEVCDKAYHSACLRPAITSIPKFGWKCQYCRICSDCGSRTPGSGFSSRWHRHFTVCDSCYQQRNKGFSCPLCHRAYRTGSSKEMAQCTACKKFVHRTCDPEADPVAYQKKIEAFPDYQYVCPTCKNMHQFGKITLKRKESFEDSSLDVSMNTSHESLTSDDMEIDLASDKDDYKYSGGIGLGKGKPFTARKKMAFSTVRGFKSKYNGKAALCPPVYQKKNQKMVDFGKKKCTKTKMRGVFGAPSTGLQGPVNDSQTKSDRECDEKKILLCSTSDEFVLSQDICMKCSALGTDQEGCLIGCVQCGQCYHPYCADSNKVPKISKTMLERGWKCIKCAVCEGCGKCDNESVLILCDDCNIAYHTYCVEPKLDGVPEGSWKCKWCAHCLTCGANEPGVNSVWLKNYTECGPCASRVRCPSCYLLYGEGDLIIKCENCERWLHGVCDQIRTESDAEKCAIEGYSCLLCRPKDTPPPHLLIPPQTPPTSTTSKLKIRPVSPIKVVESVAKDEAEHFVDGTYLSENGLSHLTTLLNRIDTNVFSLRKKKRTNNSDQGDQGILDSIESVIAGGEIPSSSSAITYRDGMVIEPREDGKPPEAPEGFNISTNESGVMILKKKRIRKIGVGGFNARMRTGKKDREEDEAASFYNDEASSSRSVMSSSDEKPRKKNRYRKPKSKYAESYPSYIQDAFFGRELLDTTKDVVQNLESSDSDSTEVLPSRKITNAETVTLSQDELKIMELVNAKREEMEEKARIREQEALKLAATKIKVENEEKEDKVDELTDNDNETFKDILNMSGNFLDTIMSEDDSRSKTNTTMINDVNMRNETDVGNYSGNNQKDEFTDILGPNFNIESMVHESGLPNMDGKDVEDIFKDVLTDDTQNSHDPVLPHTNVNTVSSSTFPINHTPMNVHPAMVNNMQPGIVSQTPATMMSPSHSVIQGNMNMPPNRTAPPTPSQVLPSPQNIPSPATYPATSPYHSEYSNSPSQFSPAFSEPPSPWVQEDTPVADSVNVIAPSTTANQRTSQKMEVDECLGDKATISSVLYANSEHPELKSEFPVWSDRCKQILKKWRALPAEKKQPYLNQARENRTTMTRVRKSSKEQEKVAATQKVKESEQEKNWKQIQAIRQQQMHDPRIQTLQRIQQQSSPQQQNQLRQMASNGADNSNIMFGGSPVVDTRAQLQIVTSPDTMSPSMTSPGRPPQRFPSPIVKLPPPSPVNHTYQRVQGQDVFTPPSTPRPQFYPASPNTTIQVNSSIRQRAPDNEMYSVVNSNPEMNRQLRELLQKQQMESNQTDQQPGQTRIWVQDSSNQQVLAENTVIQNDQMNMPTSSNVQGQMFDNSQTVNNMPQPFRPPFPPRSQRVPFQVTQQMLIRQRMPQQMDPRFRLLMQQQQHQLLQQQQQQQQQRHQQMQQQQLLQQQQQQQQQQHHNHHHGHNHHHHHHQQQQQQQQQQPQPQQQPQQTRRKVHKIPPAAHQYKLRDSRMSEDKKHENTREITETVFSSEIKSVKHPQTISLGINGSVIFDDIDENWKSDNSTHIPQRTYHYNNLSHNSNKETKLASKVESGEGAEKNTELNKISAPHVIGSLPIAEYEGSPRRYGLRTTENIMPTLLSSPTVSFPRPGFPQRILDESPIASVSSVATSLPPTTTTSSFNYLYEYSETRKVLEEFFKPDDNQDKAQQFRELEYELKRRRRPSYDQGNSYVGLRLAEARDGNLQSSPRKHSQDSSEYSNNQDQGFLSNYTVSTENLGLPLEFQMSSNSKNLVHHNRYSISPDLEKRFGQSRNFTLSPETTDCESNFGEGDSDVSSLMLIMDPDIGNTGTGPMDRLYPSMPVLEDGLSSGHTSDNENNNATVLLMKKQITEIEREIIEKSNRSTACSVSSTTTAPITVSSISQPNFTQSANVPSTSLSVHSTGIDKISESRNSADIDLDSLDPLGGSLDRRNPSPPPPAPAPHRESRNFQQSSSNQTPGGVEATIKDIRMTLQRTKTLPLRPSCVTNGDNDDRESCNSNKSETPIWVPRKGVGSGPSADEDEPDTDLETDRLLGQQRTDDQGFFDEKIDKENGKKKNRNKEGLHDPSVLIEGVLFRARYLGSTQLVCEGQPTKATRMMQAEEAVSRIKAPDGESQPSTEVDLFISTEKIMVLNTDLKEIMMDHALRTISYIADIGDLVVLMARRRFVPHDVEDPPKINRTPKMICHVFESEEAQFIAQSIGQAFQVAYMEFLKANGIEDHSFVKEMDYQEVLNSQEIFGDELQMFAKKELQKEVVVPKMKGEILGVVIVESGWGSMLPTVVIANLAPSGAAARCGQLNIGDQIIAVNGVSLVGLPLSTCQNYIKNSKPHTVVKLTVVPCAPVVEVKIKRPDTKYQLGFSVQNGVICSLLRGGIAERGGVRVGHRIIEINNQSVVAVPHEKIVTLLATSVGEILMKTMPTSMFRLLTGQETPVFI